MAKSGERIEIEEAIETLPWFGASTEEIQKKLLELPENTNGFLRDLSLRPVEGGGVRIINLEQIAYSPFQRIFGIFVNFRVQALKNPEVIYGYEYFSWAQGPESGSKGLVLLENNEGEITHIVCLRGFKFAVGKEVYDLIGGFAEPDETGIAGMIARFETEIKEELGIPNIEIKRIISLGKIQVDAGAMNNHPNLFAAVIDGSEINLKEGEETENPDPFEMRTSVQIISVERIDKFVEENDDDYFLGCIVRLQAKKVLR